MFRLSLILLLSIFFGFGMHLHAQSPSVDILSINKELPSNSVTRIFQDRDGYMWFGTKDGLCRYDAYRLLTFRSSKSTPNLLTDNEVTCLAEDRNRHLLIGTKKGLNILDKGTYKIHPIGIKELRTQEIRSIVVDNDGSVWVGTFIALYRCTPDLKTCKRYDKTAPITSVNYIYKDNDNNIWVTYWAKGLYRYDRKHDRFLRYPRIGKRNNPFTIFQDHNKQLWIGTWGEGLYMFYPSESGNETYIPAKSFNPTEETTLHNNSFFSIQQDDVYGYLWLMSQRGIYALRKGADNYMEFVDIHNISDNLNNIFSELYKDHTGNLWIAAFSEGAALINMNKPAVHNYTFPEIKEQTGLTSNIHYLTKDNEGDIWLSQNRMGVGVSHLGGSRVQWCKDMAELRDLPGLESTCCFGVFPSLDNEIWIGPGFQPAVHIVKKEKGKVHYVRTMDLSKIYKGAGNDPRTFLEDPHHNVWIVTARGLFVKPIHADSIQATGFLKDNITAIAQDKSGKLWLSTRHEGVFCLIPGKDLRIKASHSLKELCKLQKDSLTNHAEALCIDTVGNVWIGTTEGYIFEYQPKEKKLLNLSNQFDYLTEGVLNMQADRNGKIWIATHKRVIEYDPITGGKFEYRAGSDMTVTSLAQGAYMNYKGEMYYGGNQGIVALMPYEHLSDKPKNVRTSIVDVKVNGVSLLLETNNEYLNLKRRTLYLNSDDHNIEIDFSSLNYSFPDKIRYAYKMEGVDKDWVEVKDDRMFAFYNQLPKGKRTFSIKCTDVNGLWSHSITKIEITKAPAFYETWWAYTFYVLAFLLMCYGVYYRMKRRIQLRHELHIARIEKEKSEELVQAKLRYFTNISHDLLTPLTIISCLIEDASRSERNSRLEIIGQNVNRLKRLLQQILDFRKIENGRMVLKVAPVDVVALIRNICYSDFVPLMNKRHQQFMFECEEDSLIAYIDADKIDKVVFNLLSNASKYTGENGTITVKLNTLERNGHPCLSVAVQDTGKGIPPKEQELIFKRFYNNRGFAGDTNGIGLSLTKELLALHHGSIELESEVGKGSTFTAIFPIDEESYSSEELAPSSEVSAESFKPEAPTPESHTDILDLEPGDDEEDEDDVRDDDTHILLVEDNEELLTLMKRILSRHYDVETATNGEEALAVLKDANIDIVISDIMMPKMDGLTLCRILKGSIETSHIPVILLTAKNQPEDRVECYNAGASAYITKPFEMKVLEARIRNFLTEKHQKQEQFRTEEDIDFPLLGLSEIDKDFLIKAVQCIESHAHEPYFGPSELADELAMSKSTFYRKVKLVVGIPPKDFIRNVRLKRARKRLRDWTAKMTDVAYECGFTSPKYFSTCFRKEFGMSPKEFQAQCQENARAREES